MVVASSLPCCGSSVAPKFVQPLGLAVAQALDTTQIFNLIDSYLPFEVCLHYQLLPLRIDRDRVYLGMVDPSDPTALDYATRIAEYWNYRLIANPIARDRLHTILSAYLNFMQLQGPGAYQEKLRLANQMAKTHRLQTNVVDALPPPSLACSQASKPMLNINDETLILDESEMVAIEASESSVIPLSGNVDPALAIQREECCLPPPPPAKVCPPHRPHPQPTSSASTPAPTPVLTPSAQQQLDQLGETALKLTQQLRQAMHALQAYGTTHPAQALNRQKAIVALGRDLHQVNQDFKVLLQAIAAQKAS